MSAKMEYKGTDVEEAIANACAALNVSRDELEIKIVSTGSTGIFGLGKKKAVVQVFLRKERAAEVEEQARPEEGRRPAEGKKAAAPAKSAQPPRAAAPKKAPAADEAVDLEDQEDVVGDPVSPAEMEAIKEDLAQILQRMGCPSPITIEQDQNNKVHAHIAGDFIETLVGPEGQTLDGLQYIMRKIITRKFPQKVLFSVDAGDFRVNRMQELQERALRLAQEVKETGKTRTIPAINPAERRIVHMALQSDTEIRSRSVGEGLFKKVLIYLPGKGRRRAPRKRKGGGEKRQQQ
ncbi:RNA-binding cell elongation regulator Jag/EloR [Thiovibrio sp. JS02]